MTIASCLLFLYSLQRVLGNDSSSFYFTDSAAVDEDEKSSDKTAKNVEMDNVTTNWIRQERQVPRMGKVWIITNTELPSDDIETVASWDVSEDSDVEDDAEFKLTTEKLAYILIGSCCVFSILCLCIVVGILKYKKRQEKKRKKLESECYFYPTAKCYRIRSYSDAHFYQVPIYYKDSPYMSSPPYVYYRNYPYYYQSRNDRKNLKQDNKEAQSHHHGTKRSTKFNAKLNNNNNNNNSTLHEQTLDIRGRKTVKRITVLPPAKSDQLKDHWKNKPRDNSSAIHEHSPIESREFSWNYTRKSSRSKKSFRLNTLTDSERHAWLNCIYLLDELHKCHANTPNSESANVSTVHQNERSSSRIN